MIVSPALIDRRFPYDQDFFTSDIEDQPSRKGAQKLTARKHIVIAFDINRFHLSGITCRDRYMRSDKYFYRFLGG